MKIAIAVHGRFHAFDLVREMNNRGHETVLFTNYPRWAVRRFGVANGYVRSLWAHGVVSRGLGHRGTKLLHRWFGGWARRSIWRSRWDAVMCWSGIGEETFQQKPPEVLTISRRGSAHIRMQDRILADEEERTGLPLDRPHPWLIAREEREYTMADKIFVVSNFARDTFIKEGVEAEKVAVVPLGVQTSMFRADPATVEERERRILRGDPLKVLYVGAISLQKGMWDLLEIAKRGLPIDIALRGPVSRDARRLAGELVRVAEIRPPRPQQQLVEDYREADLFIFPTLQDGYAMVLDQARASGLPVLCTTNCAARDTVTDDQNGWVLPVRSPDAFEEKLRWCDSNRAALAAMARRSYEDHRPRDWAEVAATCEARLTEALKRK